MGQVDNKQMDLFKEQGEASSYARQQKVVHTKGDDSVKLKYALVDGGFKKATPSGLRGRCPHCHGEVVARDGKIRERHWSHLTECSSSPSRETDWHKGWKNEFPKSWQEIEQIDSEGEIHRADVKTDEGWIVEIQYSPIQALERDSREKFYLPKMVWVVNGTRLKMDLPNFFDAWNKGIPVDENRNIRQVHMTDGSLVRDWKGSNALVFFDFEDGLALYGLLPNSPDGKSYIYRINRSFFVSDLQSGQTKIGEFWKFFRYHVLKYIDPKLVEPPQQRIFRQQPQRQIRLGASANEMAALLRQLGVPIYGSARGGGYRSNRPKSSSGKKKRTGVYRRPKRRK